MRFLPLLIIFSLLINGCIKDSAVKPPDFEEKLSITSFICPDDTTINVLVSKNQPLYGEIPPPEDIENANVTISDGANSSTLQYLKDGKYTIPAKSFPLVSGTTYAITATTPDGLSASASCKIPGFRNLNLKVDTFMFHYHSDFANSDSWSIGCHVYFDDIPGEENFYSIQGYIVTYVTPSQGTYPNQQIIKLYFEKPLVTDFNMDGQNLSTIGKFFNYNPNPQSGIDSVVLKIYVLNTNYEYYKYHLSLSTYLDGSDPFDEISPVYSNVSTGIGIFAAYTKDEVSIRLK
jgi:hypothetical protein